jgi:membrane associated rhomboid family serine protease
MFFPLHDGIPLRRLKAAIVTWAIIALCALIWLMTVSGVPGLDDTGMAAGFGVIPVILFGSASLPEGFPFLPIWMTPASSILIHAGLAHLAGNMLFLWVFGDNVEDAMGHERFALFFTLCGVAGAMAHCFANPLSQAPLIGASGAISGVIAAYLMLYPHVRIFGLAFKLIPVRAPAYLALGAWVLLQVGLALAGPLSGPDADVGWWAHVGGLIAGAVLTPIFIQPGIVLFQRLPTPPV